MLKYEILIRSGNKALSVRLSPMFPLILIYDSPKINHRMKRQLHGINLSILVAMDSN